MRRVLIVLPLLVLLAGCGKPKELPTDVRFLQELANLAMGDELKWRDAIPKPPPPPTMKQLMDPKWRFEHMFERGPSFGCSRYRYIWEAKLADGTKVKAYVPAGSDMIKEVDYLEPDGDLIYSWGWETERYRLQLERLRNAIVTFTDMNTVEKGLRTLEVM